MTDVKSTNNFSFHVNLGVTSQSQDSTHRLFPHADLDFTLNLLGRNLVGREEDPVTGDHPQTTPQLQLLVGHRILTTSLLSEGDGFLLFTPQQFLRAGGGVSFSNQFLIDPYPRYMVTPRAVMNVSLSERNLFILSGELNLDVSLGNRGWLVDLTVGLDVCLRGNEGFCGLGGHLLVGLGHHLLGPH